MSHIVLLLDRAERTVHNMWVCYLILCIVFADVSIIFIKRKKYIGKSTGYGNKHGYISWPYAYMTLH